MASVEFDDIFVSFSGAEVELDPSDIYVLVAKECDMLAYTWITCVQKDKTKTKKKRLVWGKYDVIRKQFSEQLMNSVG